jgi:hypothetical protein
VTCVSERAGAAVGIGADAFRRNTVWLIYLGKGLGRSSRDRRENYDATEWKKW